MAEQHSDKTPKVADLSSMCNEVSTTLKMMSHPQRLLLLYMLKEGPKTVTQLQENLAGVSQSHVSQFLNRLKLEKIVQGKRSGNFIYYSIKDPKVVEVIKALDRIYCANETF